MLGEISICVADGQWWNITYIYPVQVLKKRIGNLYQIYSSLKITVLNICNNCAQSQYNGTSTNCLKLDVAASSDEHIFTATISVEDRPGALWDVIDKISVSCNLCISH